MGLSLPSLPPAASTSVVRWNHVVPDDRAADVALRARQRGRQSALLDAAGAAADDDALLPTELCGNRVVMEECGDPGDRSVHMRTAVQRKPSTPASALIESAEFAIAAVLSGPLTLTDDAGSSQTTSLDLSVGGSPPDRQPAPEPQPTKKHGKNSRRSTARKKATIRRAQQQAGAPQLAVRMTKPSGAVVTRWPQRSAGSKALGAGPSPLVCASPNFSALLTKDEPGIARKQSLGVLQMHGRVKGEAQEITRSGACIRDEDAWVSPSTSWKSPTLRRQSPSDGLADADEHEAPKLEKGTQPQNDSVGSTPKRRHKKRAAAYAISERGSKGDDHRHGSTTKLSPEMSDTLAAEYARIKLSTCVLKDLATEAAQKHAAVEETLRGIEQAKLDILENQHHVAKSWLDRQLLSNLVAEVEQLVEKVQDAAKSEAKEWTEATAVLRKGYAQKRWGGLQRQHEDERETNRLGGLIEEVAVSDERGKQGVVFVLKSGENNDSTQDNSSSGRRSSWTWADHEAAKLQLAKRRQAEAAQAEVRRLQELLEIYQTKHDEGASRLEKETTRLRAEKQAESARVEERTAAAQQKRRDQAAEAVRRRRALAAANVAISEEQQVVSMQAQADLIETRAKIRASKVKKAEARRKEVAASHARHQAKTKQRLEQKRKQPAVVRWEKPLKPLSEAQIAARLPAPPHPRAAAHAQLSESYSEAGLYEKAVAEAEKALAVEGGPFLRQLRALSKALAGLGNYSSALRALEQAEALNSREEERAQVQSDLIVLRKVATAVAAAVEAANVPIY